MIRLNPMNKAEYEKFRSYAVADYAMQMIKAGNCSENEALKESENQFNSILPDGLISKNNYLYTITDEETKLSVGSIWIVIQNQNNTKIAFIADIIIDENYRGKGYGKATMGEIEKKAKELGANKMSLHVFGTNNVAISLYEKMGYKPTNIKMAKELD